MKNGSNQIQLSLQHQTFLTEREDAFSLFSTNQMSRWDMFCGRNAHGCSEDLCYAKIPSLGRGAVDCEVGGGVSPPSWTVLNA